MKKIQFLSMMLAVMVMPLVFSCSKDDDDNGSGGAEGGNNTQVVVNENDTTSNGSIFSAIDDKNFYLDYIKYTVEEGHLVVTGYDKKGFKGAANIVARITYNGNTYEVLKIGLNAFYGCEGLTSVNIPNSVTSVETRAFAYCSGLTSVTIGNSVTDIWSYAFGGCSGLTSIKVESGNVKYDSRDDCNAIIETATNVLVLGCKSTTIPNNVTSIGEHAFFGCSGLTSVTIPEGVTSIGACAFSDCI